MHTEFLYIELIVCAEAVAQCELEVISQVFVDVEYRLYGREILGNALPSRPARPAS